MIDLVRRRDEKRKTAASAELKKARAICREVEEEAGHALTAAGLMQKTTDDNLRENFRAIARWHYARAARKFREAGVLFTEIKSYRISAKTGEHFKHQAKKMISSAEESEIAGLTL